MDILRKTKTTLLIVLGLLTLAACGANAENDSKFNGTESLQSTDTSTKVEETNEEKSSDLETQLEIESETQVETQVESDLQSQSETQVETTFKEESITSTKVLKDIDWENSERQKYNLSTESVEITSSGIYEITGSIDEGSVVVNVDKTVDTGTVYLVLNGVNISSNTTAPINIIEAKDVVIILADGTTNNITQGSITTDDTEFPSAAVYSKADLFIVGNGILNVVTEYNDGITSKDDLNIESGNITVKAAQDCLVGKDSLEIKDGTITVDAGKDGLKASNEEETGLGNVEIKGGTINILNSDEGIEAVTNVTITGGVITINSTDDGINVKTTSGTLEITGGEVYVIARGDGLDSNGNLTITGGKVVIDTSLISASNSPLDADGVVNITQGTVFDTNGNDISSQTMMGPGGGMPGGRRF